MRHLRQVLALTLLFVFLRSVQAQESVQAQDTSTNKVIVGVYVNDVQSLNLREHSYSMDIYVWFRWRDPSFDPTETFEVVNPNELWDMSPTSNTRASSIAFGRVVSSAACAGAI